MDEAARSAAKTSPEKRASPRKALSPVQQKPKLGIAARGIDVFRLGLVQLLGAHLPREQAENQADELLLICLAHEILELGPSQPAIVSALQGRSEELEALCLSVSEQTGFDFQDLRTSLAKSASTSDLFSRAKNQRAANLAQNAPPPFTRILDSSDPFGKLGQALRRFRVSEGESGLHQEDREIRRAEGGYYTPFRLAHRLAKARLGTLSRRAPERWITEKVPSVLDPACGAGTFLVAAFDVILGEMEKLRQKHPDLEVEPVLWTVAALHGVDIDPVAISATRLAIATRAILADQSSRTRRLQLGLFAQPLGYGRLIADRIRLGDSLLQGPRDSSSGTRRLQLRLIARDTPGQLPKGSATRPVRWDQDFPLRFTDEEGSFLGSGGFDIILANPPFVPIQRIAPDRRKELQEALETAHGRFDLFIGFVERALSLLTPKGRASLIVPRTFLSERNAQRCRKLLLSKGRVDFLEDLGPVDFDGTKVHCVALGIGARRAGDEVPVKVKLHKARTWVDVPTRVFRSAPHSMLRLQYADPAIEECLSIRDASIPLGRYFCAAWGARGTPVRDFHFEERISPLCKPMLKGEDVSTLRLKKSSRFLLYDPSRLYRPSRREFFESPKLVFRKVTGAGGLICAVDPHGHYTDDSLACVVSKAQLMQMSAVERRRHQIRIAPNQIAGSKGYDLYMLAALFQTPLVQSYYRLLLGGGLNVFPKLIEELPIPFPEVQNSAAARALGRIGRETEAGLDYPEERANLLARELFGLDDYPDFDDDGE